jgi:hypothetical protein
MVVDSNPGRVERLFLLHTVHTCPGVHPTSIAINTVAFPRGLCGRGVVLTTCHLSLRLWMSRDPPPPPSLHGVLKGDLYLYLYGRCWREAIWKIVYLWRSSYTLPRRYLLYKYHRLHGKSVHVISSIQTRNACRSVCPFLRKYHRLNSTELRLFIRNFI